ncbi:hypothetical protein ACQP1W_50985 [Spirillospora sp. CA-255316]
MRLKTAAAGTLAAAMVLGAAGTTGTAHADDTWRPVPPNWTWPDRHLNDVEAVGAGDVWAAGGQGRVYVGIPGGLGHPPITLVDIGPKPLLQRWTGRSWTSYAPPGLTGEGEITDVEAVAPDDVWAAGFTGYLGDHTAYLAHWDGAKWTRIASPSSRWSIRIYADGKGLWLLGAGESTFHRFADGAWTEHRLGEFNVTSVLQPTRDEMYAFAGTKVHHWDGDSWSSFDRLPGDGPSRYEHFYTATAEGELWAIVRYGTVDAVPVVHRWAGARWERVPVPEKYTGTSYHQIHDFGGPVIQFEMRESRVVHQLRWTGSGWTELIDPVASVPPYYAVAGDGSLWAGDTDTVYRLEGKAWTPVETPISGQARVVSLPGSRYVFAWSLSRAGDLVATTNAP